MPAPQAEPWEGQAKFLTQLEAVEQVTDTIAYKGWSTCRVCQCRNGSEEHELGGWVWPSGLRHYIEAHNIKPSEAFISMIAHRSLRIPYKSVRRS